VRTDSRIPHPVEHYSPERAQQIVHNFASCLVKRRRALASAYILDRTSLSFDKYQKLADSGCAEDAFTDANSDADVVELGMGGDAIRFALAEALLATEIDTINPAHLSGAAQLPVPPILPWSARQGSAQVREKAMADDQAMILWYKFGDCVVRDNPLASRTVLRSALGSTDEAAAMQALMPDFNSCVVKGTQLSLNRVSLHGALALAYYSLAHAPAAATTKPALSQR